MVHKGCTKETCPTIAKSSKTLKEKYASGQLVAKGHSHTEESKRKLSESMRRFYKEHPEKIPFRVWHYSKGESYPEKHFREWLENEGIEFKQQYAFETYNLDFLIGNIDLEIDGEQHFRTQRAIDRDLRRNQILEDNGFKVIRVRWSHYQKMPREEKESFLSNLKEMLLNRGELPDCLFIKDKERYNVRTKHVIINTERQSLDIAERRKRSKKLNNLSNGEVLQNCIVCGKHILSTDNTKYCSKECYLSHKKKTQAPTKEQLLEDYKTMRTSEIARKYGVGWQQIGKWRRKYNIPAPPRSKCQQN